MAKEIIQATGTKLSEAEFNALAPLSSRALFWRARYIAPSPVLDQLPFVFWLVENTRPSVMITLGVADPVAHFALCQAIEKLGLESMCFGVEPQSEDPAEDRPDLRKVLEYNELQYGDFSQIVQMDHAGAAETLLEAEIDLLVVNQPATQALLDEIDRHWLPRLSDKSVILFTQGGNEIGYRTYIQRISHGNGVFTLNPADGACVVLRGAEQNDRLHRLVQLKMGNPGYLSVRNVFSRLGELHSKANLLDSKSREAGKSRSLLDQKTAEVAAQKKQIVEIQGKTTKLNERLKERTEEIATTQVKTFELTQKVKAQEKATAARNVEHNDALKAAKDQTASWKQRAEAQAKATAERDTENNGTLKAAKDRAASLEQKAKAQMAEFEELKSRLETTEQNNSKLQQALTGQDTSLKERFKEIAALGLEIDTIAKQRDSSHQKAQMQTAEFEELKSRLDASEKDNSRLQQALTDQDASLESRFKDIAALGLEINTTTKERDAISHEVENLSRKCDSLTENRDVAHQELEIQGAELADVKARLDMIEQQRNERDDRVAALEASTSWKVTSPLRQITSAFRK